jgi:hypothetical protein
MVHAQVDSRTTTVLITIVIACTIDGLLVMIVTTVLGMPSCTVPFLLS